MQPLTRRETLTGASALGVASLAGCLSAGGDSNDDGSTDDGNGDDTDENGGGGNGDESGNGDENGSDDGTGGENGDENGDNGGGSTGIVDSSLETVESSCGRLDGGESDVTVTDTTVTVEGWIGGLSNPCHEAVLGEVTLEDRELLVSVGVRSTLGENEACADCIGEVSYEAEISLEEPIDAENVRVTHPGGRR